MTRETIQGFLWSIQENVWENVWAYFWFSVLGLLFVVWPIAAWIGRRRRRKTVRELLGDGFREYKSYIRSGLAISVDEDSQRFAFATPTRPSDRNAPTTSPVSPPGVPAGVGPRVGAARLTRPVCHC